MNSRILKVTSPTHLPYWIMAAAAIFRFFSLFISGQIETNNYWEYGELARNLINGNGFSFPFVNEQLEFTRDTYPSALMPPGYVFLLIPFFWISDEIWRNVLLFGTQISISVLAMYLYYRLIKNRIGETVALITILLQAVLPDLIFASISVGPTVWVHFFVSGLLWFYFKPFSRLNAVFVILFSGGLVYLRAEILLFLLVFAGWAYFFQSRKWILLLFPGVLLMLSPWIFRNIGLTGKAIISNNLGVNLYRGNNPGNIGDWPSQMEKEVLKFRKNPRTYESNFDEHARQKALDWIRKNPQTAIFHLPEKFFRFWFIDWPDTRTHQFLYWLPWIACLILGVFGIFNISAKTLQPEMILLVCYTLIILIFFPQVRYQTMVKFFFLPFAGIGMKLVFERFWPFTRQLP
ncbi:MAG TPA: hypothetical protein PKY12_00565 [Catalimonadaceae bacterium]|nr:hypothetical protein [Catalimonadaceae bacterium]